MFDILTFRGPGEPPNWSPMVDGPIGPASECVGASGVFILDDALGEAECRALIEQFELQDAYPVGVDGYAGGGKPGSHRSMAWAVSLAKAMTPLFEQVPQVLEGRDGDLRAPGLIIPAPFANDRTYRRLGSTPWMRFMRYDHGGMHVPHYDAPFESLVESYITLFSWVLYLNDVPEAHGGSLDFVDDGRADHPCDRPREAFADWRRMARAGEITRSVQPRRGRLLVFPHWHCHQVAAYTGDGRRYIIRGDLAYGIEP